MRWRSMGAKRMAAAVLLFAIGCSRAEADERIERFVFPELVIRASPPPVSKKSKPPAVKKPRRPPRSYR